METTYLYAKTNKSIYEQILDDSALSSCRHTNMVIATKDSTALESDFVKKHLIECHDCQKALRKWEESMLALRMAIPYKKISSDDLKLLNAECYQLVEQSKELRKLPSFKQKIQYTQEAKIYSMDLLRSFLSLTMVKGFSLAILSSLFIYLLI